jgi:hypothetical protein
MSAGRGTPLRCQAIIRHCKQNVNIAAERVGPLPWSQPMNDVRIISLDGLLRRLEDVLGTDSLLYRRFLQGFRLEDERCLAEAMGSLRLYPDEVRRLVEDEVMSWLFGARGDASPNRLGAAPYA